MVAKAGTRDTMKPDQSQHEHQHQQQLVDSSQVGSVSGSASASSNQNQEEKNVMPSVVLRQQRFQLGASANQSRDFPQVNPTSSSSISTSANEQQQFDQDGLVLPKRLLHAPLGQPIMRDLNRELKFNQIRGKNVLEQKSELKRALEKLEESKRKKEAEQERLNRRTSLELRLEERAERIAKGQLEPTLSSQDTSKEATCSPLSNFSIKSITR